MMLRFRTTMGSVRGALLAAAVTTVAVAGIGGAAADDQASAAVGAPKATPSPRPGGAEPGSSGLQAGRPKAGTENALRRDQAFEFQICNRSRWDADVAVNFNDGDSWIVKGWWTVPSGDCKTLGYAQRGWVYHYAEGEGVTWGGSAVKQCVRRPGPWERDTSQSYECRRDESLVGFSGFLVGANTGRYTWTLE